MPFANPQDLPTGKYCLRGRVMCKQKGASGIEEIFCRFKLGLEFELGTKLRKSETPNLDK